ncbi:hypothetical protein ACTXT7_012574, partial [Hymenolepis weldensis]
MAGQILSQASKFGYDVPGRVDYVDSKVDDSELAPESIIASNANQKISKNVDCYAFLSDLTKVNDKFDSISVYAEKLRGCRSKLVKDILVDLSMTVSSSSDFAIAMQMRQHIRELAVKTCEKAFTKLKYMLTSDMRPPRYYPNPSIIVPEDASNYGDHHFSLPMGEIPDMLLFLYRTTPHPASNDHSSAETLMVRKSRTVHIASLPMDSIFHSSSCVKKALATVRHRNHLRLRCTENSSKLEMGPLDIITDGFLSPPLGNNIIPEINPAINKTLIPN